MSEWIETILEQLAEISSGGTPSRTNDDFWNGDIPWVTPSDITKCKTNYLFDTQDSITRKGLSSSSAKLLPTGTLLLTSRATIGEVKISTRPVSTNQGFKSLTPRKGIDGDFLFYQISRLRDEFVRYAAGSTFLEINRKDTGRVLIPHPASENEQEKISRILKTVDRAIASTETLIEKYQHIKAGLMHDLFTRGIGADGKLRSPRDQAPELYKESAIGWIPKDWKIERLAELTSKIVDGVHHTPSYVNHGIPFVTVKNLTGSNTIDFENLNYIDLKTHRDCYARADPKPNDVLVTKDGTLGVCRIITENMPEFSIFVSVALLRVTEELTSKWLHFFFDSGAYLRQLGYLSSGTGLKHIHLEHFRKFQIALPYKPEQQQINNKVQIVEDKIVSEQMSLAKLNVKKSGLMHDLLTGKVPVTLD